MSNPYTITLSNGVTTFQIHELENNGPGNVSPNRFIKDINLTGGTGVNYFSIEGNMSFRFIAGFQFNVINSAGNVLDGLYTVAPTGSTYYSGPNETRIPVTTTIMNNALPFGEIFYTIPTSENATSLLLPGRGTPNYGKSLITDMVHIMENFANSAPPSYPLSGQLWFNTTLDKVFVRNTTNSSWNGVSTSQTYVHIQSVPSTIWTVNHNLSTEYVSATVYIPDSGTYVQIIPYETRILNSNTVQITFTSSFSGRVVIITV